jgi:protein-L-isoaspartate(D-aspartate) O-methyltransferase
MEDREAQARKRMVDDQLRARGISDRRVLAAMERVPRHRFVPDANLYAAYDDHPLPIGDGQTISQPYMVAIMTQSLRLKGHERVLEIGTGSGYQMAILAQLAAYVYGVERIRTLADRASERLDALGCTNVEVHVGDGSLGWPDQAPYDRILVTAGTPAILNPWVEQVVHGGLIVAPVGDRWGQTLVVATKTPLGIERETICGCMFVPLIGEGAFPEE